MCCCLVLCCVVLFCVSVPPRQRPAVHFPPLLPRAHLLLLPLVCRVSSVPCRVYLLVWLRGSIRHEGNHSYKMRTGTWDAMACDDTT